MVKQVESTQEPKQWVAHLTSIRDDAQEKQLEGILALYNEYDQQLSIQATAIADLLLRLDLDTETIVAALLYPAYKHELIDEESIIEIYGVSINKLLLDCMQMRQLGKLKTVNQYSAGQVEKLRKMLLAMVTDIRAVMVMLAERLCQLRDVKNDSKEKQLELAKLTLEVYAPLANRVGVWQLKWEMEDLCMRYLQPDTYKSIAKWLSNRRVEREQYLHKAINIFDQQIRDAGLKDYVINGRVKHIYSIHNKMQRKNVPIEEIYDISAVRVLVETIPDCYTVLSLLQEQYEHIPEEFDDYIAQPKANGYQSIHTVLYGPEERKIEVQIRTHDMHNTSELGAASHWRYKEGASQEEAYEEKIALLRQIMAWQKEVSSTADGAKLQEQATTDVFADRVYVFTPMGDIIDLPQGATPLDFAYSVHSEVGHRCRGAKVDGKMVPLTYQLQTGNRVEVMTAKHANPSRDWLNAHLGYIKSNRARHVLAHWFRVKDQATEKEIKKTKPAVQPAAHTDAKKLSEQSKEFEKELSKKPPSSITGVDSLLTKFARCCKPLPGDDIIGYITQTRGVSIHRKDCSNISNLLHNDSNRFMEVSWGKTNTPSGKYPVDLLVCAQERSHLLRDITGALANEDVHVVGLRAQADNDADASIYITIMIASVVELNKAIKLLQQVNDVTMVRRI